MNWKEKNTKLVHELEERVRKYERWSTIDVDSFSLELDKKTRELEKLRIVERKLNRRSELSSSKRNRDVSRLQRMISEERKLRDAAEAKLLTIKRDLHLGDDEMPSSLREVFLCNLYLYLFVCLSVCFLKLGFCDSSWYMPTRSFIWKINFFEDLYIFCSVVEQRYASRSQELKQSLDVARQMRSLLVNSGIQPPPSFLTVEDFDVRSVEEIARVRYDTLLFFKSGKNLWILSISIAQRISGFKLEILTGDFFFVVFFSFFRFGLLLVQNLSVCLFFNLFFLASFTLMDQPLELRLLNHLAETLLERWGDKIAGYLFLLRVHDLRPQLLVVRWDLMLLGPWQWFIGYFGRICVRSLLVFLFDLCSCVLSFSSIKGWFVVFAPIAWFFACGRKSNLLW